jgi:hypothetical protein
MSNNVIAIGLATVSLALTAYVAVVVSGIRAGGDTGVVAELTEINERLDRLEKLRLDVAGMDKSVGRKIDRLERRIADTPGSIGGSASAMAAGAEGAEVTSPEEVAQREEALADRLEKRLGEKMEKLANRDRERNGQGEWKAPVDELAKELGLTDDQKREATAIFNEARDETFVLLKTTRLDGGSLLDDFASALKNGDDPEEATKSLFKRIFTENVPGSDRTFLTDLIALRTDVHDELGRHISADQLSKLDRLRVDLLDVKTGYDPVGDYVRAKVQ